MDFWIPVRRRQLIEIIDMALGLEIALGGSIDFRFMARMYSLVVGSVRFIDLYGFRRICFQI